MTIKEVEKITGLTAKSIRLYEQKNLIEVKRNKENDYRNYTEENVIQLKWIKLFRYLDYSIEEIGDLLNVSSKEFENRLYQKQQTISDQIKEKEWKLSLLSKLISDLGDGNLQIDEYADIIDFLESEEMEDYNKVIEDLNITTITSCIWTTLIGFGPIGWLFIRIFEQQWARLPVNAVLALVSTVVITLVWKDYFTSKKYNNKRMMQKNKKEMRIWPFMILAFILTGTLVIVGNIVAEKVYAPNEWLFYELNETAIICIIWISIIASLIIIYLIYEILSREKKVKTLLLLIGVITITCTLLYGCISNVTFVTEDKIVHHSLFNIKGKIYEYSDIERVETGFGKRNFSILDSNRRGTFSYRIILDDKEIVFSAPSTNENIERYNENTYLELEEFDAKLMELGVEKEANSEYAEYCELDREYVERFLRIIENKE